MIARWRDAFRRSKCPNRATKKPFKILEGLKPHYEKHHGVHYSAGALRAAVKLSAKHINDRRLPDKAIDVIDEVGAAMKIQPVDKRRKNHRSQRHRENDRKDRQDPAAQRFDFRQGAIAELWSAILNSSSLVRIPPSTRLASTIKLSRSGLGHPEKPIGCFLFSGPTGVGKTEVAKQLATTWASSFFALT